MCIMWQYYVIHGTCKYIVKCENVCDTDIACPNIMKWQ